MTDKCWIWEGAKAKGYGRVRWDGKVRYVHRVVYEAVVGLIPEGWEIDHLCYQTKRKIA